MTYLNLNNVSVAFSIYQPPARSLKHMLLRTAVGGGIGHETDGGRVVIRALDQINLDVREGDRVALVGHNGAGKTTLLRVMAGIYQPTQGAVSCSGFRVPLFDLHSGFDEEATGYENIVLRGLLMGFARAEIEDRFKSIAEFSGLGEYLDLPVRTYSAGMALRLAFSISTSSAADIILMDEWLATGDGNFLEKANARLHDLVSQSRILILASHEPALLRRVCNRAVLINSGRVELMGSVDEVLDTYTGTRQTQ